MRLATLDALAELFQIDNSRLRRLVAAGEQQYNGWHFIRLGHRLWLAVEGDPDALEVLRPVKMGKASRFPCP